MVKNTRCVGVVVVFDAERPGHAEMADEHGAAIDMRGQVLRSPAKRGDRPSGQPLDEAFGKRKPQIRPSRLDAQEA